MDAHAVHKQRTPYDTPSPAAALYPRSAGVKERTGGGHDETAGSSFPATTPRAQVGAEMQHRGAPSSSASTALFSPENRRTGEEFDERGKGVFNPDRRGETGGFSVAEHDAASSTSVRSDNDDFYSHCARIYAPSLSTATPKSPRPSLTMEAWMASRSQSEVTLGLAHAMGNVSAALALQPHGGWNPMGADTDTDTDQSTGYADEMGRPYRPVTPASSVVSCYPAPAASSGQGGGWRPTAAHRNQEPAGRGWHWQDGRPKAELCVQWMTTGACRNGASCRLAHSHCKEEPLHQTQACEYVRAGLLCPFGPRCPFPR